MMDDHMGGDAEFSRGIHELALVMQLSHGPLRTLSKVVAPAPNGEWKDEKGNLRPSTIVQPTIPPRKFAYAVISRLRAGAPMTFEESNRLADLLEGLLDPFAKKNFDLSAVKETLIGRYRHRRQQIAQGEIPREAEDDTAKFIVDHWNADPVHQIAGALVKKEERLDYEKLLDWLKHPND